eukprot:TRINITY_DN19023_c0_g1_i1.p1 TRINITY_DN19023_c0_g1~~TRINITY_DN19023_c0_g1_i1.p1  ORF type:complete len:200 (-),score=61.42 TRINITY_DN19023_c0_g1_i1:158-757(-)
MSKSSEIVCCRGEPIRVQFAADVFREMLLLKQQQEMSQNSDLVSQTSLSDSEDGLSERQRSQIDQIQELQQRIHEVEVKSAIRKVQATIMQIKIRQMELLCLLKQGQQVMELRQKESALLERKTQLEQKIHLLEATLSSLHPASGAHEQIATQRASEGSSDLHDHFQQNNEHVANSSTPSSAIEASQQSTQPDPQADDD